MNDIFSLLLHSNTFNFLILVAIFAFIFWKIDIKAIFTKIQEEIKTFVEKSENEKSLAIQELQRTEDDLKELPQQLENIIQTAEKSATNISQNIQKELEAELEKIDKTTETAINFEMKKFQERLTTMASEASVELAKDNAIKELKNKKELHAKYINEAIDELDKVNF